MANANDPRAEILRSRDFIGWAVTSSNGANVGTVSDILIDRKGQVRFLAVDPGFFKKPYLLPVEAMEWGEGSLQSTWTDGEMKRLPPYDPSVALTGPVLAELGRAFPRHYGSHIGSPFESDTGPTVVPLKDAKDFRLAKGAPNLRGWTVYGADNEKVGVVTQMLVDPIAMKVKYLDVDVDDDLFDLSDDRHVLVPLEYAELRERSQDVWVQVLSGRDISTLPAYLGGPVDPLLEEASTQAFSGGGDSGANRPMFERGGDDHAMLPPPRDAEFASNPVVRDDTRYAPADVPPPRPLDDDYTSDPPPPLPDAHPGDRPPILVHDDAPLDDDRPLSPEEEARRRPPTDY
ncbi:MAG TPA: PRC-barrel domain-containing protein [Longimicrobium sp.]|nr:PRC-barrel domain-containing protein [Longimicrobium sp.]